MLRSTCDDNTPLVMNTSKVLGHHQIERDVFILEEQVGQLTVALQVSRLHHRNYQIPPLSTVF